MDSPQSLEITPKKKGAVREYVEAFLTAILLAFFIRSFIIEPYKIPSKSMVPTLLVGDHIFVNKLTYGLRIPGTKKWIAEFGGPKRGEVIVFIYPEDEGLDFIKRVVGIPGDTIHYGGGKLHVNGKEMADRTIDIAGVDPKNKRSLIINEAVAHDLPVHFRKLPFYFGFKNYQVKMENLSGVKHLIQRNRTMPNNEEFEVVVPPDHYFVMGDNRDQSADSRVWGFVPRKNLKGRALFIWLSLDNDWGGIRFGRFGEKII